MQVSAWLGKNAPVNWRKTMESASEAEWVAFDQEMHERLRAVGLLAPHWPTEYGGGGFTIAEQVILLEEFIHIDFPRSRFHRIAIGQAAATIMTHGSAVQKQHLSAILDGETWCIGFSEPNAGSDLASLSCRAVLEDDHYRVNGQKVWSSNAAFAEWCLLLVRTGPTEPKWDGISVLLLDLSSPGVDVRPIRMATGVSEFCEIFLDDVLVPVQHRVGEENRGWQVVATTLATERTWQVLAWHAQLDRMLDRAISEASTIRIGGGRSALDDPVIRQDLARTAAEIDAVGELARRSIRSAALTGKAGPDGSMLKLLFSEVSQRFTGVVTRMTGLEALIDPGRKMDLGMSTGDWMIDHIRSWGLTVSIGTSEIQRNIIGERVLGLPREPAKL
jgi:alkylation response protein AidB-like acyl-CoA dehydrogenase